MMDIDLKTALTYPFKDPKWLSKVGVLAIITLIVGTIQQFSEYMSNGVNALDQMELLNEPMLALVTIGGFGFLMLNFVIQMIYQIYYSGYSLENVRNIMNGEEYPLPEVLNNLGEKFKLSLSLMVITLVPFTILSLLSAIVWVPALLVFGFFGGDEPFIAIIVGVAVAVLALIALFLFIAMIFVVIPAATFIFLKSGTITSAWDYQTVKAVVAAGWKRFLIIGLIGMGLSIVAIVASLLTCFLFWLVSPVLLFWAQLTIAYLQGKLFIDLDKEEVLQLK